MCVVYGLCSLQTHLLWLVFLQWRNLFKWFLLDVDGKLCLSTSQNLSIYEPLVEDSTESKRKHSHPMPVTRSAGVVEYVLILHLHIGLPTHRLASRMTRKRTRDSLCTKLASCHPALCLRVELVGSARAAAMHRRLRGEICGLEMFST